ncbi:F0F1 ATP synthase subunit A [Candidatus Babeliales bacterium]|nr:F0F1 ATP synthase subunit A [Candidatus Babeliales bacterium]
MEIHVFDHRVIHPLARWGFTHPFWDINRDTLLATVIAFGLIVLFIAIVRIGIRRQESMFTHTMVSAIKSLKEMITSAIGIEDGSCFGFVVGITMFTLFCNIAEALPFGEAPTSDVNTTLAIGTTCFLFVQSQGIRFKGLGYFGKYVAPIFIFLPINIIGQLSKIASLSFRLFGNILGGTVIMALLFALFDKFQIYVVPFMVISIGAFLIFKKYMQTKRWPVAGKILWYGVLASSIIPFVQLVFCIVEGVIQASVVGLLTTVYLSSEVKEGSGH